MAISEHAEDEAQRRERIRRMMDLIFGVMGCCPGCKPLQEIFSRRRAIAATKER